MTSILIQIIIILIMNLKIEFDKNISPLTNEIKHFIEYIKQPSDCITDLITLITLSM